MAIDATTIHCTVWVVFQKGRHSRRCPASPIKVGASGGAHHRPRPATPRDIRQRIQRYAGGGRGMFPPRVAEQNGATSPQRLV
jgi:hypothetical protein